MLLRKFLLSFVGSGEGMAVPSLPVETPSNTMAAIWGLYTPKFLRQSVGDDGTTVEPRSRDGVGEPLDDLVDLAGDFAEQLPVVEKEDAEDVWKGEYHLPVRKDRPELLVQMRAEEQRALLRAGTASVNTVHLKGRRYLPFS